jgi:uncharacterized protein (TIGR04255 family)
MGSMVEAPFGPAVAEIPLPQAPLVFVVAQARFERIASITSEEFIAGFQEAIRAVYPVMRREQQAGVLIGSEGRIVTADAGSMWRFDERPEGWQVTLCSDSVALSTVAYTSRGDFIGRLRAILDAAQRELRLRFCDRLGVRYVDRVTDEVLLARLSELVKSEVIGAAATSLGEDSVEQVHSFADATYRLADGSELHARWGLLPAQATFDPAIAAAEVPSWVLDIDTYTLEQERFDAIAMSDRAENLSTRIYRFFRWAVSEEFLVAHGGRP